MSSIEHGDASAQLYDYDSEATLVALALQGRTAELLELPADAIFHHRLRPVVEVIRERVQRDQPITPEIVLRCLMADVPPGNRNRAEAITALMLDLAKRWTFGDHAPYLAERLAGLYVARQLAHDVETARLRVAYAVTHDDPGALGEAIDVAEQALATARARLSGVTAVPDEVSLADLACEPDRTEDWVVPDLIERGDRLILTGFEGLGKSTLFTQLALAPAGGIHPFTGQPLPAQHRVLIVDVENPRRLIRQRMMSMAATVDQLRLEAGLREADWSSAVQLISRPEGFDLTRPEELAGIEAACLRQRPDLLVIGPLYKLTGYNTHEEEGALGLLRVLDRLRVRHNCALLSEHHAGHAQNGQQRSTRPIGSSVLLRWPEFGLGIAAHPDHVQEEHPPVVTVRRWRGSRVERMWPRELRHGRRLPWEPGSEYWHRLGDRPME